MSSLSQWSQVSEHPNSVDHSQDSFNTSMLSSQGAKIQSDNHSEEDFAMRSNVDSIEPPHSLSEKLYFNDGFTKSWLDESQLTDLELIVNTLVQNNPTCIEDYSEHLFKVSSLLYDGDITESQRTRLEQKFSELVSLLQRFQKTDDPSSSQLYLVIERCFDVFIKNSMDKTNIGLASLTIRFLTTAVMSLNYWEIYNLLRYRPAIYHFLMLIKFDLHECYARFMRDYQNYTYTQRDLSDQIQWQAAVQKKRKRRGSLSSSPSSSPAFESRGSTKASSHARSEEKNGESDKSVSSQLDQFDDRSSNRERKKSRTDPKVTAHKIISKADIKVAAASNKSSNYDPDVVHECQLPSSEEPDKMCLRRFSRKYELIRHQETVHSKKKKLFKCFVCVKQDPTLGPRIFTRHDTLAKHIRVNHRISGKEAKAEVAFSKKHAEIVEDGDITVHVGRRKTKVDFELRAHMERRGLSREGLDDVVIYDDIDDSAPDSIQSAEEEEIY